mgnify:CR=1 FL=1
MLSARNVINDLEIWKISALHPHHETSKNLRKGEKGEREREKELVFKKTFSRRFKKCTFAFAYGLTLSQRHVTQSVTSLAKDLINDLGNWKISALYLHHGTSNNLRNKRAQYEGNMKKNFSKSHEYEGM